MPRPRATAALASAPGEGRVCHFIIVATRLINSMPRALLRLRKRNSIGSMPAAAANSSVKLSTAKQLAGLPGERNGAGRMAVHAIAPGAFEIEQAHLVRRQAKEAGKGGAIIMRALGCRPHRRLVGTHVGDRAGRTERGVALHRPKIAGGQRLDVLRL